MNQPILQLWHGGHRFDDRPEIRPTKRGRAECGPGIYATTHYPRARDYAKGGGATHLIQFAPRLVLEKAALSLDTAIAIAKSVVPARTARGMVADLQDCALRHNGNLPAHYARLGDGEVFVQASALVNLCVNADAITGVRGPLLAAQLSNLGIDASFHHVSGQEWWAVIFNPRCISSVKKVPAKDVALDQYELPTPAEQMAAQARHHDDVAPT